MDKICRDELVMEDRHCQVEDEYAESVKNLEESTHYYAKYIYRTLKNVENAKEYSVLAQQKQDKLIKEEAKIK